MGQVLKKTKHKEKKQHKHSKSTAEGGEWDQSNYSYFPQFINIIKGRIG